MLRICCRFVDVSYFQQVWIFVHCCRHSICCRFFVDSLIADLLWIYNTSTTNRNNSVWSLGRRARTSRTSRKEPGQNGSSSRPFIAPSTAAAQTSGTHYQFDAGATRRSPIVRAAPLHRNDPQTSSPAAGGCGDLGDQNLVGTTTRISPGHPGHRRENFEEFFKTLKTFKNVEKITKTLKT